jgi:Terminase RNaseH-like domain
MSKWYNTIGWDQSPHLTEKDKTDLAATYPPHERDARTKGIPTLGAGAIYQIEKSRIAVDPFAIPDYWPRGYGMDVGWNKTAAIWGARNNDTQVVYLYDEYYRGMLEPDVHAANIRVKGAWIPGSIDPAANGRSQIDGTRLLECYRALGLDVEKARNAREAGIHETWLAMCAGKLKVFKSCGNWWEEFDQFARDKDGKIQDEHRFHLMACTRYFMLSGRDRMRVKPQPKVDEGDFPGIRINGHNNSAGWMG